MTRVGQSDYTVPPGCARAGPINGNDKFTVNNLLDKPQLGRLLRVSVKTIDKWVCDRDIPYLKVGRLVRFDEQEIASWLELRRVEVVA